MTLFCVLFLQRPAASATSCTNLYHPMLEREGAGSAGAEVALLFNSGYRSNGAILSTLVSWQPNRESPLGEAGVAPIAECEEPDAPAAGAALFETQPALGRQPNGVVLN